MSEKIVRVCFILSRIPNAALLGKRATVVYHLGCYLKQQELWLDTQYRKNPPKPRKTPRRQTTGNPNGRPRVPCSDRPQRRRLLSLRIYHMKKGDLARVEEIQVEIRKLETELI